MSRKVNEMAKSHPFLDVPDTTATNDKKESCDSDCNVDSGFLSGGSLIYSGEIDSTKDPEEDNEEVKKNKGDSDDNHAGKQVEENLMHLLDSGVDINWTESFSGISLNNSRLNNLNSGCINSAKDSNQQTNDGNNVNFTEEQVNSTNDVTWQHCFEQDDEGDTHLHKAIIRGLLKATLELIRIAPQSRFLDIPNDDAYTPLHLAVATGQWKVVRWLVIAGARPGPRNLTGDSPLHMCARMGDLNSCKAITDPVTQIERDNLGLGYLPHPYQKVDFQQWNYEGQTCVHVAALNGHLDLLRHLVWYGADINAREGRSGYTPLHYAIKKRDEKLAMFLLQCPTLDATQVTYGGQSALQLGFPVPSAILGALKSRGVPSPYSSDEEYDSESDDEFPFEMPFLPNSVIEASA